MQEAELYVALRDLCIAFRGKWSIDRITDLARAMGIKKRRLTLQNAILEVLTKTVPGTTLGTETGTENSGPETPFSFPTPLSLTLSPDLLSGSLLPFGRSELINARENAKNHETTALSEPSDDWQESLRNEIQALFDLSLSALSTAQRFALARYHCLVFGNCSKMESRNRYRATSVAPGIANLAFHKTFGQLTVREYISMAAQVHKNRDEKPWFSPWNITAELAATEKPKSPRSEGIRVAENFKPGKLTPEELAESQAAFDRIRRRGSQ